MQTVHLRGKAPVAHADSLSRNARLTPYTACGRALAGALAHDRVTDSAREVSCADCLRVMGAREREAA